MDPEVAEEVEVIVRSTRSTGASFGVNQNTTSRV